MLVELEIEQFIKEIESKIDKLQGNALSSAYSKINLLHRVKLHVIQDGLLVRECMKARTNSYVYAMQWQKKYKRAEERIKQLQQDLDKLKENIADYELRDRKE
jgi:uncharacterized protein YaaR (DUF327 family)